MSLDALDRAGSLGSALISFPQASTCPRVWPAAPMGPPSRTTGVHTRAGFALTHQMPAGARAEPLYFPGWRAGAFLQANGSGPPRSPSTSPRLPSPALISAALGSWEN